MTGTLFNRKPSNGDHRWYANLRSSMKFADIREWCETSYTRYRHALDRDFIDRFRRDTPKRFSELFFAAAFDSAGWSPIDRVRHFDLAYRLPTGGRLLVEVTTPEAQSSETWHEEQKDNFTFYSADSDSLDAALLRLTSACKGKADAVNGSQLNKDDYIVIAISGVQLNQETPVVPSMSGSAPDFIRAFLPIGDMYMRIPTGPQLNDQQSNSGYHFNDSIRKSGSASSVDRTAFVTSLFEHVHAVAYTPLFSTSLTNPHHQVGVLHNPLAIWENEKPDLEMGWEYSVVMHEDSFDVRRRKLPDAFED